MRSKDTLLGLIWFLTIGFGFLLLMQYEATPGEMLSSVTSWPSHSKLQLDPQKPTLVMSVHPFCPCSRASVSELSELMDEVRGQAKVYVLAYKPSGFDTEWEKTDIGSSMARIPGVVLVPDMDGKEAERFHATISGQVLLYSPNRKLLFNGGITPARGQTGSNAGRTALVKLIFREEDSSRLSKTPVFGCPIASFETAER